MGERKKGSGNAEEVSSEGLSKLLPEACLQDLEDCSEHLGSPWVNWALQVNCVLELFACWR